MRIEEAIAHCEKLTKDRVLYQHDKEAIRLVLDTLRESAKLAAESLDGNAETVLHLSALEATKGGDA